VKKRQGGSATCGRLLAVRANRRLTQTAAAGHLHIRVAAIHTLENIAAARHALGAGSRVQVAVP
jgi:hypothetical protein